MLKRGVAEAVKSRCPKRDRTFSESVNWITAFFMIVFHLGAVAALFFFTWKGLVVAIVLTWVFGSLGIGIGYTGF